MSRENVQIAREAFRQAQAGDTKWSDWVHPDIVWDFSAYPLADLPTSGKGKDALLTTVLRTYYSGWRDLRQEITEIRDAGDDVLVVTHEVAGMRDSDAVVERDVSHLWTIKDGKWTGWRLYATREEALKAAGLSE